MSGRAPWMMILGGLVFAAGLVLLFADKIPWLGHLPGDIHIRGKDSSFHFPVVTCLLVSVVLTVLLNLLSRFFGK